MSGELGSLNAPMRALGARLSGDLALPGDEGWEAARLAWNLAVDTRPVAVALPASADDMIATVQFAAEHDVQIAFIGGGHNAGPLDWSKDTLLVKTTRMSGVEIDPQARRARVLAGTLANTLASAAGDHGLAYLAGTSPDVGLAGYFLGGGYNWMVRKHGLACNSILAVELVTAGGELVRVDRDTDPDLFWALRGGGGNFGAATALELALFQVPEIYAGCLFWPIERATEILNAWREWVDTVPVECHSIGRMLQLPDLPFLPPHLNARSFVLAEAAFIGSESDGAALLEPLRALGPEFDTIEMMPTSNLSIVNMDPEMPLPYDGEGALLTGFTPESIASMVGAFVGSSLAHVEVRHLGGAAAVGSPDHGVLDSVKEPFFMFTFGLSPDADTRSAVKHDVEALLDALAAWDSGRRYLGLCEARCDPRTVFPADTFDRLAALKAKYDPTSIFQANHAIAPR